MRDVFYMDSLGKEVSPFSPWMCYGTLRFRNICLPIYNTMVYRPCQGLKKIPLAGERSQTTTAGVVDCTYSRTFSGVEYS
jgi:hypothetical protein